MRERERERERERINLLSSSHCDEDQLSENASVIHEKRPVSTKI